MRLTPQERQKIIEQMSRYTGLSKEVIDQANLRVNVRKFTHYLLIDQKLRVGRLDGALHRARSQWPAGHSVLRSHRIRHAPPFTSVFNNYVRTELGYKTDMPYYVRRRISASTSGIGDRRLRDFLTLLQRCGRRW